MNYDTLIPNLEGKIFNHIAMLTKPSDNLLCIYLKKTSVRECWQYCKAEIVYRRQINDIPA
jgi:hypothetical protein